MTVQSLANIALYKHRAFVIYAPCYRLGEKARGEFKDSITCSVRSNCVLDFMDSEMVMGEPFLEDEVMDYLGDLASQIQNRRYSRLYLYGTQISEVIQLTMACAYRAEVPITDRSEKGSILSRFASWYVR